MPAALQLGPKFSNACTTQLCPAGPVSCSAVMTRAVLHPCASWTHFSHPPSQKTLHVQVHLPGSIPTANMLTVPAVARKTVMEKYNKANGYEEDSDVIYGDTDSVMVNFRVASTERAMELGQEAAEFVSATFIKPIRLEFEKVSCSAAVCWGCCYARRHCQAVEHTVMLLNNKKSAWAAVQKNAS